MKVFEYWYDETWGEGQGIVIAESEDEAIKMMMEDYDAPIERVYPDLKFTEIDITKPQLIDHSWCE